MAYLGLVGVELYGKLGWEYYPKLHSRSYFWTQNTTKTTQTAVCAIKTKIINSDRIHSESTRQPAIMVDTYKAILVHFMSYVSGHAYDKDYEFSQEELGALNPMDVKKYMCMKAYGTAEPNRDDHPLFARSSTLMFWKKAIS